MSVAWRLIFKGAFLGAIAGGLLLPRLAVAGSENQKIKPSLEDRIERANVLGRIGKGKGRKVQISPETEKDGIATGCVFAYGQVIPPPYKVEYVEAVGLLVNGVQVKPSLLHKTVGAEPREKATKKAVERFKTRLGVIAAANKAFSQVRGKGETKVKPAVEKALLESGVVQEIVSWEGTESVIVVWSDGGQQELISLSHRSQPAGDVEQVGSRHRRWAKNQNRFVESIQNSLGEGHCIAFKGSGGLRRYHRDIRGEVAEIMSRKFVDTMARISALEGALKDLDFALDIVENGERTR